MWSQESEKLYIDYQKINYRKTVDALLSLLDKARKEKWINTVRKFNLSIQVERPGTYKGKSTSVPILKETE